MPFKRAGSEKWYINVGGIRKSSGTAVFEDAKALEDKLNHDRWLQDKMGIKPPRSWTEAAEKYLGEVKHQAYFKTKAKMLIWFDQHFRNETDIRNITRDRVDDLMTNVWVQTKGANAHSNGRQGLRVTPEPSPQNSTANHYVAALSAVLHKACEEWDWIERVPRFRYYPKPEHKELWLTPEKWREMEKALPEHLRLFCTLALATGLRDGKLWRLEWPQIDLPGRVMSVSGNKVKRGATVPLNDTAMAVLEALRSRPVVSMTRVFPGWRQSTINQFQTDFGKVRKIPGLERVGIHTLRHTFNTWLAKAGVSMEVRARLVGHGTGEMQDIYTHWDVDWLRPYSAVIDSTLSAQSEQKFRDSSTESKAAG